MPSGAWRKRGRRGNRARIAMSVTAAEIEQALRAGLAPVALEVQDDSHLHVGHAGAARAGTSASDRQPGFKGLAGSPGIASYMMPCVTDAAWHPRPGHRRPRPDAPLNCRVEPRGPASPASVFQPAPKGVPSMKSDSLPPASRWPPLPSGHRSAAARPRTSPSSTASRFPSRASTRCDAGPEAGLRARPASAAGSREAGPRQGGHRRDPEPGGRAPRPGRVAPNSSRRWSWRVRAS